MSSRSLCVSMKMKNFRLNVQRAACPALKRAESCVELLQKIPYTRPMGIGVFFWFAVWIVEGAALFHSQLLDTHGVRPDLQERVLRKQDILVSAKLNRVKDSDELKRYSFSVWMKVRALHETTLRTITRYDLYPKMISYIDRVDFDAASNSAWVEGGLWGFRLRSQIHFQERSKERVDFEVVNGHFKGMRGAFEFEPYGARETVVVCTGSLEGRSWPPTLIMETGAEMVMSYVARRMKRFTEAQKDALLEPTSRKDAPYDNSTVPTPRRRL